MEPMSVRRAAWIADVKSWRDLDHAIRATTPAFRSPTTKVLWAISGCLAQAATIRLARYLKHASACNQTVTISPETVEAHPSLDLATCNPESARLMPLLLTQARVKNPAILVRQNINQGICIGHIHRESLNNAPAKAGSCSLGRLRRVFGKHSARVIEHKGGQGLHPAHLPHCNGLRDWSECHSHR
jgi:hypothetical protein